MESQAFWKSFGGLVNKYQFSEQVKILRCHTQNSAGYLVSEGWKSSELVFLHADHSFFDVFNDLKMINQTLPVATVSGDDFNWRSVRYAVILWALLHRKLECKIFVAPNQRDRVLLQRKDIIIQNAFLSHGWKNTSAIKCLIVSCQFRLVKIVKSIFYFTKLWQRN